MTITWTRATPNEWTATIAGVAVRLVATYRGTAGQQWRVFLAGERDAVASRHKVADAKRAAVLVVQKRLAQGRAGA